MVLGAAPAGAATFGAIAYSISKDKYGRAWNYGSRAEAEAAAQKFCDGAGGSDCATTVWLQDGCGSAARADTTSSIQQMGVSWGFESEEASKARALSECEQRNPGQSCRIVASVCSWKK